MSSASHEEFRKLCALSTSDHLTEAERNKLNEHLATCGSCRRAKEQFDSIVDQVIPAIGAAENRNEFDSDSTWSEEAGEREFLKCLLDKDEPGSVDPISQMVVCRERDATKNAWPYVWSLYAAGILLTISLALAAYRFGNQKQLRNAQTATPNPATANESQLPELHQRLEMDRVQLLERNKIIVGLKSKLKLQSGELTELKDLIHSQSSKNDALSQRATEAATRQDELEQQVNAAQSRVLTLERTLAAIQEKSSQDATRSAALEAKVEDLTRHLGEREAQLTEQQELLSHDRDIRELMGARDLYITEVYDVAGSGETRKPFGRVFYTKEKSLIFYAYDLDHEAQAKTASSFQAWGRKGPNRQDALNLGIFYEDNKSKKRWILKCDDPKALAQIDAVFVTMEPRGGSKKPTDKPLLFAYLKVDSNHP